MKHCEEQQCVKLNIEKVKLAPSIGHIATDKGLCVDPRKVQAIIEMPRLTDVARHDTVSGKVPTSFVGHDNTIACMTKKDADFLWDEPQQKAFDMLKAVVTSTPVLRYYNLGAEVTLQCDALQSGLGVAMM